MPAAEQYRSLEFDRFLEQLANYAGSELTHALIRDIEVVFHRSRVDENLAQTTEALTFIEEQPNIQRPAYNQIEDLTGMWERIYAGELVDHSQARALRRYFDVCDTFTAMSNHMPMEKFPQLADARAAWQPQEQLASATRRVFNEDGDVRDNASTALSRIRDKLRRFEGTVRQDTADLTKMIKEQTGEDALMTIRNNRFVVLMPRNLAQTTPGTVVDMSGSGQSIYFEPSSIAPLNADRQHLFLEEDQEVRRILRDYGIQLSSHMQELKANLAILVKYDYIFARARHAMALVANRPQMTDSGGFELLGAIHPLLYKDFVSEDLVFDEQKALIISGVNAGGKTVLLKLLGLYSLMAALGCYVPGKARLPYLSGIYADIGDDQSTIANLSTFTAHLHFVKNMWQEIVSIMPDEPPALVLVDEIGTGTEPGEGAAFAYGLINALLNHNVKLAVTTHYDLLKTLGFETKAVKNVSLEFDQENLKPTFRILDDQPGQSFAFFIAERWGIDQEVISEARKVLGQEEQKMASVIGEIEALKHEAEDTSRMLRRQAIELEGAKSENEKLTTDLKEQKRKFAKQSERVKQEVTDRIEELLKETKQKLKKKARQSTRKQDEYVKAASKQAQVARRQQEEAEEVFEEVLRTLSITPELVKDDEGVEINVGDQVFVASSGVKGKVLEVNDVKREAILEVYGKRMNVKLNKLQQAQPAEIERFDPLDAYRKGITEQSGRKVEEDPTSLSETSDTIDLHGQTVEEATESMDEFLSSCLLTNVGTIYVMHGIGTGRLRQFVREYLKRHPQVTNIRTAGVHEGGIGITLADLK